MSSNEAVFVISLDANGELVGVTMNGVEGTVCAKRPEGTPEVVWSYGNDPENGDGIEFLRFETMRCCHFFCQLICW
jgi:hypothetical protein